MGFKFGETLTVNGHRMDEVTSALQKSIRRGLEYEAIYFATEMHLSGFGGYCWKRLRVISSEDCSPENVGLPSDIWALWQMAEQQRKDNSPGRATDRLHLIHAVVRLCRAKKNRLADHAGIVMYSNNRPKIEIPDWAIDKHTGQGKAMGRGAEHLFEVGFHLENRDGLEDVFEEQAKANQIGKIQQMLPSRGAQRSKDSSLFDE